MTEAPITIKVSDQAAGEATWVPGPAVQRIMRNLASNPAELDDLIKAMEFGLGLAINGIVEDFATATLLWTSGVTSNNIATAGHCPVVVVIPLDEDDPDPGW